VAAFLAVVALLAVLSALTLAPFGGYGRRRYIAGFLVCLVAIWTGRSSSSHLSGTRYDVMTPKAGRTSENYCFRDCLINRWRALGYTSFVAQRGEIGLL
jgi:hypothetical protein